MSQGFKDIEHLLRLAGLFLVGLLIFLGVRAVMIPKDFGELGHYRPGALEDNRARAPMLAGRAACAECHPDAAADLEEDGHGGVGCEACHGALAAHAEDPVEVLPEPLDIVALCSTCHQRNAAKPEGFPQVDVADHSGGLECDACHEPHRPGMDM
jgi:hypothetical protein